MEANTGDVILLFDTYSLDSQNLHYSFQAAGYSYPAVVMEDDGFLPDGVTSLYGSFLGEFAGQPGVPGRPRYFNEIQVPEYWEISGTNSSGKVSNLNKERGRIYYAQPAHKRLVRTVDWTDEDGVVRCSEHYNRYGALYARTVFNKEGRKVNKAFFDAAGREILTENYVTGDILLNEEGRVHLFQGKTELALYFLRKNGYEGKRLFFNSLSFPFFVSQRLEPLTREDILFWQEPIRDQIPGNMQIILNKTATRTRQIFVQKKLSYERLLELGASPETVKCKGFVYPFARQNAHRPEVLICTNSDRVEQLHRIVEALPKMQFHVAALTEMSQKLMSADVYENVHLYPGVKMNILDELFDQCDFYLDINREGEIVSAVQRAFLHDQMVLGFAETLHNREYVAPEYIYTIAETEKLIEALGRMADDPAYLDAGLKVQKEHALSEGPEAYRF